MKTALYKQYANTKALGSFPMSNFGGLEVLDILWHGRNDWDNYLVACFNWGTGRQQIRRHKVCYTENGRAYIRKQGWRFYLDQIMRI